MNTAMTLDAKFIQLATPLLSEFGFSGIKELVSEQLALMLQSKIDQYDAEDHLYASRFGGAYEIIAKQGKSDKVENFELDDALNDWRFAREAAALYRAKLQEMINA